jgi:hypothetical protein
MQKAQGRCKVSKNHWLENLKGRDNLIDLGGNGEIILKCIFRKWGK